ncbi:MAG TPA: C4-type zinc ribbon domain-containing protein [Syntrophobacteraceae bacterium]|nr:C4-type zinc ribbon domain-containing protein [Syntrophobacteraceae bacterium]
MLDQLKCLIEYQKIEDKKNQLIRSYEEAPRRLAELEKEFEFFEGQYLSKKEEYDDARKTHRTVEQQIEDLRARMGRQKTRLGEVRTNKEYQAMLKEIDETKKEVSRNEDIALELMDKIDRLVREVGDLGNDLEGRRRKLEEERAVVQRESGELKGRLDRLEAIRRNVRDRLTPDLLKKTDFLFEKQAGIAVSAVENGVCKVCHMNIPPQKFIELQRDEDILQCPHCHRFLYWPGHEGYCVTEEDMDDI